MYDVGNSALVLLATSVIPIYFSSLAPEGGVVVAWSYAETIASLIIALLMPILGSIADMEGMKKKFIVGCVGTGVVATVALGIPTSAMAFLVIYVISSVALNSSMVFYDALLVDATTDDRMDEVSSYGYAWGYIGSCVALHRRHACSSCSTTTSWGFRPADGDADRLRRSPLPWWAASALIPHAQGRTSRSTI